MEAKSEQQVLHAIRALSFAALVKVSATKKSCFQDEVIKEAALRVGPKEHFSTMNRRHADAAGQIVHQLLKLEAETKLSDLLSRLSALKADPQVNAGLLSYATLVYLAHSKDKLARKAIPDPVVANPERFLKSSHFVATSQESPAPPPLAERSELRAEAEPVTFEGPVANQDFQTLSHRNPESRVAWWREDPWLNSHHWHWHIVYPSRGFDADGKPLVKDRQGELFYYMHQQMLARYDTERCCSGLRFVAALDDWDEQLEGYDARLSTVYGGFNFGARPPGLRIPRIVYEIGDFDTPNLSNKIPLTQLAAWRDRIREAIDQGYFIQGNSNGDSSGNGGALGWRPVDINLLGGAVEPNGVAYDLQDYYGQLHNIGHDFISQANDPERLLLSPAGVMGFLDTSIRDPVFFRWHRFVDDLFVRHKERLAPYTFDEFKYFPATISRLELHTNSKDLDEIVAKLKIGPQDHRPNKAYTYFENKTMNFGKMWDTVHHGDISPLGDDDITNIPAAYARIWHLNHVSFSYSLTVNSTRPCDVMVRVFMALADSKEADILNRRLFFEMDKFHIALKGSGDEVITRQDIDSTVTLRDPLGDDLFDPDDRKAGQSDESYCKCGLPAHLLLPRGESKGATFRLFVMLTDWNEDKVDTEGTEPCCSSEYCGLRDKKYPDKRPMGYPFDRFWGDKTGSFATNYQRTLQQYKNFAENIVTIRFLGSVPAPEIKVDNPFVGQWMYRSYLFVPTPLTPPDDADRDAWIKAWGHLVLGEGQLTLEEKMDPNKHTPIPGELVGKFDFGVGSACAVTGRYNLSTYPPSLVMEAVGIDPDNKDWDYKYEARLGPVPPEATDKEPAVLGTVVRVKDHGSSKKGVSASFQLVKMKSHVAQA